MRMCDCAYICAHECRLYEWVRIKTIDTHPYIQYGNWKHRDTQVVLSATH